jgi:hypothetical protein
MRWLVVAVIVAACSSDHAKQTGDLQPAELLRMLRDRDAASGIEMVFVDVTDGPREARYQVRLKTTNHPRVAYAPFPGELVDALYDAHISWGVTSDKLEHGREHVYDAVDFLAWLGDAERAARIVRVEIEPFEAGAARYVITTKQGEVPSGRSNGGRAGEVPGAVYADYPGRLVDALAAANIPHAVKR